MNPAQAHACQSARRTANRGVGRMPSLAPAAVESSRQRRPYKSAAIAPKDFFVSAITPRERRLTLLKAVRDCVVAKAGDGAGAGLGARTGAGMGTVLRSLCPRWPWRAGVGRRCSGRPTPPSSGEVYIRES